MIGARLWLFWLAIAANRRRLLFGPNGRFCPLEGRAIRNGPIVFKAPISSLIVVGVVGCVGTSCPAERPPK